MESSIAEFLARWPACERLPTLIADIAIAQRNCQCETSAYAASGTTSSPQSCLSGHPVLFVKPPSTARSNSACSLRLGSRVVYISIARRRQSQ